MTKEKKCKNCTYFAEESSVCVNDDSEHCADFVSEDDTCEFFYLNKWFSQKETE